MPRRTWTYASALNVEIWNQLSTVGGMIFGLSALVWVWVIVKSVRSGEVASANPWNAPSLEWSIPSPPAHYNFPTLPRVRRRDPLWNEEYKAEILAVTTVVPEVEPEMPNPSFWPIVVAAGASATWILVMTGKWWAPLIGLAFTAFGVFSWAFEDPFAERHD
jgi:cytochrome c oxidase subunit I